MGWNWTGRSLPVKSGYIIAISGKGGCYRYALILAKEGEGIYRVMNCKGEEFRCERNMFDAVVGKIVIERREYGQGRRFRNYFIHSPFGQVLRTGSLVVRESAGDSHETRVRELRKQAFIQELETLFKYENERVSEA